MTVAFAVAGRRERVELELVEQVEEVRALLAGCDASRAGPCRSSLPSAV